MIMTVQSYLMYPLLLNILVNARTRGPLAYKMIEHNAALCLTLYELLEYRSPSTANNHYKFES